MNFIDKAHNLLCEGDEEIRLDEARTSKQKEFAYLEKLVKRLVKKIPSIAQVDTNISGTNYFHQHSGIMGALDKDFKNFFGSVEFKKIKKADVDAIIKALSEMKQKDLGYIAYKKTSSQIALVFAKNGGKPPKSAPDGFELIYPKGMYGQQSLKESDKFEPHMMYDPKTGKGYKAKKIEDHERMATLGYVHEKPKSMNESEVYVDEYGMAHDDEGNSWRAGGQASGTYNARGYGNAPRTSNYSRPSSRPSSPSGVASKLSAKIASTMPDLESNKSESDEVLKTNIEKYLTDTKSKWKGFLKKLLASNTEGVALSIFINTLAKKNTVIEDPKGAERRAEEDKKAEEAKAEAKANKEKAQADARAKAEEARAKDKADAEAFDKEVKEMLTPEEIRAITAKARMVVGMSSDGRIARWS